MTPEQSYAATYAQKPQTCRKEDSLWKGHQADQGFLSSVMIQQIPTLYTRKAMLLELRMLLGDVFDFFWMPSDVYGSARENRGYAIVNFSCSLEAMKCIATMSGRKYSFVTPSNCGGQAFGVRAAQLQGLEANMEDAFYELGGFNVPGQEDSEPVVMRDGKLLGFEEAMQELYPVKYEMLLKKCDKFGMALGELTTDDSCDEEAEEEDNVDDLESSICSSDGTDSSSDDASAYSDFSACDPSVINSFRAKFGDPKDNDDDAGYDSA
eukprot:gnl/MRDRNA2_/MRDRNA2_131450_c0_seq1.p1 gnl/MRDRNA2_/MRDRNA2_131450_c0~~gnl/MRDRNA2_/MRDRNA2_131450_c0_seq1.p1  ORF type:complete len:266 (-),score=57.20 gnl/MRDRNA2_/MRDRNA2_131450_c0_seq1:176-973(-)